MTNYKTCGILRTMTQLLDLMTECRWKSLDYLDAIANAIVTTREGHRSI